MSECTTAVIGCDPGDKQSTLCILRADGRVERSKPIKTVGEAFRTFFFARPPAHVVIEVGAHSRWVSALLEELGHRVVRAFYETSSRV